MTNFDLDQQANVLWIPRIPAPGRVEGGESRHFERLSDAIRFAMEELPEHVRGSAWITTDSGSLDNDQIAALYKDRS